MKALTIEQAKAALESAKADFLEELRQDSERSEGSCAQERRREAHQQSLRDRISQCELDLEHAKHCIVEQAQAALSSAKANYLEELRQDSERSEGSGAQERRREAHQQSLRDRISQCERDLEHAQRLAAG
ncbi:MAG: hypothetical protein PBV86_21565 [Delftia lacustris]|uniref:hypothetical protein n=1 Tax=Delftia TaxID=80865 RepID=UPI00259C6A0E|nr:hypothetical protein [Delftia sp.]